MNILHMKYAVEVARLGSLNKAAETLLVAQPNISRSIKELEADLGITIFNRSAKGTVLTPEGEEFINYARGILKQIDEVEMLYRNSSPKKQKFSVSVPHACYISDALANFSKDIGSDPVEIFYNETTTQSTVNNVLNNNYKLGIIRYAASSDKVFKAMLEEKGLAYELVTEFSYNLIMSKSHPLAQQERVTLQDLSGYIEIAHADPNTPSLPVSKSMRDGITDSTQQKIFVFERASQFDLLAENSNTFMWVSPVPLQTLERYGLVQKKCSDSQKIYKDMLIYREGYRFSRLDKQFITELCEARRRHLK